MVQKNALRRGFTLIELIIVIAIIAIIISAVFVALDPVKRLNASRNSTRRTDITAIAQALQLYVTDEKVNGVADPLGALGVNTNAYDWQQIGTDGAGCDIQCRYSSTGGLVTLAACVDLSDLVPNYLPRIPDDPSFGTGAAQSGYAVTAGNGAIVVRACNPEGEGAGGVLGVTPNTTPALPVEVSR